ncbi:acetyl-CoA acetyltransferase [Thecamonas trahens ATCC 50062]|uniref:acetyl-CoA C-acetyltransferase n=1 Tax=Thecamonas trahens ATCC 50062 TaxID=461836 RepID=A0A0L0DQ25_THETB|nr:acetyl-CoA acetyltransferase [Thecamonas trahens ATCC 50062]KNC53528.1 acetyl-CoA acetyltransferase [Thecamonas trahens ATCC 50062]|eukprot:XP_013761849.1 acetyl-CoA acetyltransferase [Thecamonas trahens ATCC 50062]
MLRNLVPRLATTAATASRTAAAATARQASSTPADSDPVIVSTARTAVGTFGGSLASLTAPQLGAAAASAALARAGLSLTPADEKNPVTQVASEPFAIDETYFGNVLQANVGQAPAKQVVIGAGLGVGVPSTTVNKVCASGLKAVMLGAQAIRLGEANFVLAGGMESMSQAPFYLPDSRWGSRYGHSKALDGIARDGLSDAYDGSMMGVCAEACATEHGISRAAQDEYATLSYQRAREAAAAGLFDQEIAPVTVKSRRGESVVDEDEEPAGMALDKLSSLRTVFKKDGTVTAGNASKINDGASALVIASYGAAKAAGLTPIARILGMGDASMEPIKFTDAPTPAIERACARAGVAVSDIDYFEINEAFAVVALCNARLLGIDVESQLNVNGGAVALGHPIGSSGSRILVTLASILQQRDASLGVAAICNGGGGASAVVIERM